MTDSSGSISIPINCFSRSEPTLKMKMVNHGTLGTHGNRIIGGSLKLALFDEFLHLAISLKFRVFRVFRGSHFLV
jgi:hypothetical protein